jgi:hypothetical protein
MSEEKQKRVIRTIGINFPFNEEGNRIYDCLHETKRNEDRSMSKVIFRILKQHYGDGPYDEEQETVIKGDVERYPTPETLEPTEGNGTATMDAASEPAEELTEDGGSGEPVVSEKQENPADPHPWDN